MRFLICRDNQLIFRWTCCLEIHPKTNEKLLKIAEDFPGVFFLNKFLLSLKYAEHIFHLIFSSYSYYKPITIRYSTIHSLTI